MEINHKQLNELFFWEYFDVMLHLNVSKDTKHRNWIISAGFVNDRNNFLPISTPLLLLLLLCLNLLAQITFRNKWTGTITWLTLRPLCSLCSLYCFVCLFVHVELQYKPKTSIASQFGWKLANPKWEVAVRFINFHPESSHTVKTPLETSNRIERRIEINGLIFGVFIRCNKMEFNHLRISYHVSETASTTYHLHYHRHHLSA